MREKPAEKKIEIFTKEKLEKKTKKQVNEMSERKPRKI